MRPVGNAQSRVGARSDADARMPMLFCGNEFAVSLAFLLSGVRCLPLLPACSLKEEGVVHALHGRMYVNLYWGQIFFTHAGKYTVAKRARSELQLTGLMIGLLAIVMYSYIHITIPHLTIYTVKYIE